MTNEEASAVQSKAVSFMEERVELDRSLAQDPPADFFYNWSEIARFRNPEDAWHNPRIELDGLKVDDLVEGCLLRLAPWRPHANLPHGAFVMTLATMPWNNFQWTPSPLCGGVGTGLLKGLEMNELAASRDGVIYLHSVPSAIMFYHRLGFVPLRNVEGGLMEMGYPASLLTGSRRSDEQED